MTQVRRVALCAFVLLLSGCTLNAPQPAPGEERTPWPAGVVAAAHPGLVNATPGRTLELLVTLTCDTPLVDAHAALGSGTDVPATPIPETCPAAFFVPLTIPLDAAVDRTRDLQLSIARNGTVASKQVARAVVLAPAITFNETSRASIVVTGRLAGGEVFETNDPRVASSSVAKHAAFRAADGFILAAGQTRGALVPGLHAALFGMQPGESRVVTLEPAAAFGEASLLEREARDEFVPRDQILDVNDEYVARSAFNTHIRESGQGDPSTYDVGDVFVLVDGPNAWRYRITAIDATSVTYRLTAEAGERFTLYPFWPNATVVVGATDSQIALYTTPPTDDGSFTMRRAWPNMTRVESTDDDTIRVRHSPPVGLTYEGRVAGGIVSIATVADVTDTHIVITYPNPGLFAGQTVTYDVRIVDLVR